MKHTGLRLLALFCVTVSLLQPLPLDARELPVRAFTTADGLSDNRVHRVVLDSRGLLWILTASGMFRMTLRSDGQPVFAQVPLRLRGHAESTIQIWWLESDAEGTLWIGTRFGLVRMLADGRLILYTVKAGLETDHVFTILYNA